MPRRARVVLASYNQLPHLRRAIRGYLRQTCGDFALTVADDGSTADTLAFLDAVRPEFENRGLELDVVWQPDEGFRKTRVLNEAVRRSTGEPLLIFSDGDCIPPAHFVERHIAAHAPRSLHVGGAIRLSREESEGLTEADVDAGRYEALGGAADRRDLARRRRKSVLGVLLRRRNRPKILGLNFALDRRLLEEINGFDERFRSWGVGEDSDVRDRAMRCRPRPRVRVLYGENDVYHLWHPVSGSGGRERHREYMASRRPIRAELGLRR
jgi:glycosyltransferase involved in cell wall biosynthesis